MCRYYSSLAALQEAELMQQKAVLEGRIRKLNEEAEIARWFECVCVWFV